MDRGFGLKVQGVEVGDGEGVDRHGVRRNGVGLWVVVYVEW